MNADAVTIVIALVMLLGVVGAVVPALPDLVMMWVAGLIYGVVVGWGTWGPWLFGLMTLAALAGLVAEVWVSSAGARLGGASGWAILGGLVLGLIGFVFFSVVGAVIGLLAGTFLAEYLRLRDARQALRGAVGMALGCGASMGVKLGLALLMAAAWVGWVLAG
ncbi:MAG TPA: DUF456 domain-containing protein [Anaerolineales bacterium]|nr:DUF456 domain-containing protein [Anaerolineales bacterium]